jgi:hypothetical protein
MINAFGHHPNATATPEPNGNGVDLSDLDSSIDDGCLYTPFFSLSTINDTQNASIFTSP